MQHPRVGQSFRQEYYKGHAEDHFKVISLIGTVTSSNHQNHLPHGGVDTLQPGVLRRHQHQPSPRISGIKVWHQAEPVIHDTRKHRLRGDIHHPRTRRPQQPQHKTEKPLLIRRQHRAKVRGRIIAQRMHNDIRPRSRLTRPQRQSRPHHRKTTLQPRKTRPPSSEPKPNPPNARSTDNQNTRPQTPTNEASPAPVFANVP